MATDSKRTPLPNFDNFELLIDNMLDSFDRLDKEKDVTYQKQLIVDRLAILSEILVSHLNKSLFMERVGRTVIDEISDAYNLTFRIAFDPELPSYQFSPLSSTAVPDEKEVDADKLLLYKIIISSYDRYSSDPRKMPLFLTDKLLSILDFCSNKLLQKSRLLPEILIAKCIKILSRCRGYVDTIYKDLKEKLLPAD